MTKKATTEHTRRIRLIGRRNDNTAYQVRDFFERSVMAFEWLELASDDDCRKTLD